MRRRTDAATQAPAQPANPTPPLQPGAHDWVSPPPTPSATPAQQSAAIPAAQVRAQIDAEKQRAKGASDSTTIVDAGDSIEVTIGRSIIYPVKFNGLEVGPLTMSVRVRQGETPGQAWSRARSVLEELYQAELDLRLKEFVDNLDEARKRVRNE